jgi:hypothetical protein
MRLQHLRILFVAALGLGFAGLPRLATQVSPAHAESIPPVTATVYGNQILWSGTPGTPVTALIRSAAGQPRAIAPGVIDPTGEVTLTLRGGGGGGRGGGGGGGTLRPGDFLVMTAEGSEPVTLTVPTVVADVDADADRVTGMAPAGAEVQVTLVDDAAPAIPIVQKVMADGTGAFSFNAAGKLDIGLGDAGSAMYTGTFRSRCVPSPRRPSPLLPQHTTRLSPRTAHA